MTMPKFKYRLSKSSHYRGGASSILGEAESKVLISGSMWLGGTARQSCGTSTIYNILVFIWTFKDGTEENQHYTPPQQIGGLMGLRNWKNHE